MKKLKTLTISLLALTALVGCGGGEEVSVDYQAVVDKAIDNRAIITYNNNPLIVSDDESTELSGERDEFVVIATSIRVDGVDVGLYWTPNMMNAFTFLDSGDIHKEAHPNYPDFGEPDRRVSLTVTARVGEYESASRTYMFDITAPTTVRNYVSLPEAHNIPTGEAIIIEGQVTRILTDYNAAYIQDANGVGFSLYRLDTIGDGGDLTLKDGSRRKLQVGDYIEATGEKGAYNGLQQLSFITIFTEKDKPEGFPAQLTPHVLDETFFKTIDPDTQLPVLPGFEESKYSGQGSLVKVDGLTFVEFRNVDNQVLNDAQVDAAIASRAHIMIKTMLNETPVDVYLNYHMGKELQGQFVEFIRSLGADEKFGFEGVMGIYTTLQLLPMAAGDLYK